MTRAKYQWILMLITCLPVGLHAQLLAGDSRFPILNEIRWDMMAGQIKNLCESRGALLQITDSTLVFRARFFGTPIRAKVQLDRTSQLPRVVDVAFEEATAAIRDTLVSHFTRKTGKPPLVTIKEKSAIIFTIKLELASWRDGNEMISAMTMMRGSEILGVTLLVSRAIAAPKT